MSILKIGCCGACCKTCRAVAACRGCKTGYDNGKRNIRKAKCVMKICCIQKNHQTCADCDAYNSCPAFNTFYQKNGYKYAKYRQATAYIRSFGYEAFVKLADQWKNAYGKYPG